MGRVPELGDIFRIPIDRDRWGLGQIAGERDGELYIVVYDLVVGEEALGEEIVATAPLLFAALSLDAKIFAGDWPIVGNRTDNLAAIPQPVFKVGQAGTTYLESRDLTVSRPATEQELAVLRYRTVVAPIRLEKALRAHLGDCDWDASYEALLAHYAFISSQLLAGDTGGASGSRIVPGRMRSAARALAARLWGATIHHPAGPRTPETKADMRHATRRRGPGNRAGGSDAVRRE